MGKGPSEGSQEHPPTFSCLAVIAGKQDDHETTVARQSQDKTQDKTTLRQAQDKVIARHDPEALTAEELQAQADLVQRQLDMVRAQAAQVQAARAKAQVQLV